MELAGTVLGIGIGYGVGSLLAFWAIVFFENRAEKKRKLKREDQ